MNFTEEWREFPTTDGMFPVGCLFERSWFLQFYARMGTEMRETIQDFLRDMIPVRQGAD